MIRILQVVNIMDRAGLETMLMNYYRNVDRTKVQFDFLTHRTEKGAYEDEIIDMGGRVYHAPRLYPQNYPQYFKYMKEFFEEHPGYQIIHSHIDTMSYFPLLAAKYSNVPVRIGHSHSSKLDIDLKYPIKYFALKRISKVANVDFACGEMAGKFMWGDKKFKVVHNAIDLEKFTFDETIRKKIRQKLKIAENELVIGHVGRFNKIKNQLFLIDIFNEFVKNRSNSMLVLIGKGEDETKIRSKVHELKLDDKVIILVDRSDVNELYQSFDLFVMPSLFEGLPVVGVEAQANGLPCIFSENISEEVILTGNAVRIPLANNAKEWSNKISNTNIIRNAKALSELQEEGYDIKLEARKLEEWYLNIYKDKVVEHENCNDRT